MDVFKSPHRGLKICCAATSIFLIIVFIVFLTLGLTVFKPKQPKVSVHPIGLENIDLKVFPHLSLNVSLGMVVTIDNQNYGSFKYKNSTAFVDYHSVIVAEVPIESQLVPARSTFNITGSTEFMADKLISSPYFLQDVGAGHFEFTATVRLSGKASVMKIFKFDAKAYSTCDVSVSIESHDIQVKCKSKIKL